MKNIRSFIPIAIMKFTLFPMYSYYMHVEVICYFQLASN